MSKAFWFFIQILIFVVASSALAAYLGGDKVDAFVLFVLFMIGYRVGELHIKVDELLKIKDNAPIK